MIFPDLPERPVALQFSQTTFTATEPGPRLIVLGAVHGNEVSGTRAILKMIEEFESGARYLQQGTVTFVPITNPLAYNRQQRNGDRNLNRNLAMTSSPVDFEDRIANWLCPLLGQHDVLLDIHSFQRGDRPFALFGPENNSEGLQTFQRAAQERALALRLGVNRFVDGWLDTYARGVAKRMAFIEERGLKQDGLSTDPKYGVGTTECMRAQGGYAVTLECGQHDDPDGPKIAYQAIDNTLRHLGLVNSEQPIEAVENYEHLTLMEVIDRHHPDDQFAKPWLSFDAVKAGELIGVRHDGTQVRAPHDARIVFPNTGAQVGQEWFYLATVAKTHINTGN